MKLLLLYDNPNEGPSVGVKTGDYVTKFRSGVLRFRGSSPIMLETTNIRHLKTDLVQHLRAGGFDGVMLVPPLSDDRHTLKLIEQARLPMLRVAPLLDVDRGNSVGMDDLEAAKAIVGYLLDRGHRRVGFIRGPNSHLVSIRRFNGYVGALGGKGLSVSAELVVQGDFSRESGRVEGRKLLAAKPTAIFASNDEMAVGVIDAARELGIKVPEQVGVVGYDDVALASMVRPKLTTVRQPLEEMGMIGCEILVNQIQRPHSQAQHRYVPFEIIERDSVIECPS